MATDRPRPRLELAFLVFTLALTTGCPSGVEVLVEPTQATLPPPADAGQLQAIVDSADGKARISVFPGTPLPPGGLTITTIDPSTVESPLGDHGDDFAVELGPEGAVLDPAVRLSFLLGGIAEDAGGALIMPEVDVYTTDNGVVTRYPNVHVDGTEDGLLIAHVMAGHFSKAVVEISKGLHVTYVSPKENELHLTPSDVVITRMSAENKGSHEWLVTPQEGVSGPLGNLTYDGSTKFLPVGTSVSKLGYGTCFPVSTGLGRVLFVVQAEYLDQDDKVIDSTTLVKRIGVRCVRIDATITVTFCPESHTTSYSVQVTRDDGSGAVDITNSQDVNYSWNLTTTCGGLTAGPGGVAADNERSWNHTGCTAQQEANSTIHVLVQYPLEPGRTLSMAYTENARANEGAGPIAF